MSDANGKHFTLYAHMGPNPWKVVMILQELGLDSYNLKYIDHSAGEHKKAPYTDLNPNGRFPTLIDHKNNDFTIWESGAIVLYLVEKYDKEHKISFDNFEDEAHAKQWLMFQMSGQGPYFGQAVWFDRYHSEKIPSAVDRYVAEINRVMMVLDNALKDKEYLVGGRVSYADLSFVPWNSLTLTYMKDRVGDWPEKYHNVARWHKALADRESVKTTFIQRDAGN